MQNIRKNKPGFHKNLLGYYLLIPAALLIILINVFPLVRGIMLSFMQYSLRRVRDARFIGFENFIEILSRDKEFSATLFFSFFYSFVVVGVSYIMGMCFALLLNRDIKFRGLFRALILIPWIIPPVVAAINWAWILNDQLGFINLTLRRIGLIGRPVLFLAAPALARLTVCLTSAWKSMPFMTITLLAGMQGIPNELYESASIDGAGFFRSFRHITVPMLVPVSLVITVLQFIWTFNSFENIYLLTNGGPGTATHVLPIYSYITAFYRGQLGYASAISTIMLIVLLLLTLLYMRILRSDSKE